MYLIILCAFQFAISVVESDTILAVCMLLDPRFKRNFFENAVDLQKAEELIKSELLAMAPPTEEPVVEEGLSDNEDDFWSDRKSFKGPSTLSVTPHMVPSVNMEFDRYVAEPVVSQNYDPLAYWNKETRYPLLKKVALKYHVVMGTSVPSERLFSDASNVLTIKRNRLGAEIFAKLLFMCKFSVKDWNVPQ